MRTCVNKLLTICAVGATLQAGVAKFDSVQKAISRVKWLHSLGRNSPTENWRPVEKVRFVAVRMALSGCPACPRFIDLCCAMAGYCIAPYASR